MEIQFSVDPALDNFLRGLFSISLGRNRKIISIERVLAGLIEMPRVSEFIHSQLQPGSFMALRDELQGILLKESSIGSAAIDAVERRWRYWLNVGLKSFLRLLPPREFSSFWKWLYNGPEYSGEFSAILIKAFARSLSQIRGLNEMDLFLSIVENAQGAAGAALQKHGVTRFDLVCYLAYGGRSNSVYSEFDFPGENDEICLFLLDDDFTPMDFVVGILETIFSMSADDAKSVMMDVHQNGRAVCGIFPFSIASEKLRRVERMAAEHQHPLRASLEAA